MRIWNNAQNCVYDENDPRCRVWVVGRVAFIQALDVGDQSNRFKVPLVKRYAGPFDIEDFAESILEILNKGAKWDPDFLKGADRLVKEHKKLAYEIEEGDLA